MEIIAYPLVNPRALLLVALLCGFIVAFAITTAIVSIQAKINKKDKKEEGRFNGLVVVLITLVFLLTFSTAMFTAITVVNSYKAKQINEINETYNLEITDENLKSLYYPSDVPKDEFKTYGTTLIPTVTNDKLTTQEVILVWSNDELKLLQLGENKELGQELPKIED